MGVGVAAVLRRRRADRMASTCNSRTYAASFQAQSAQTDSARTEAEGTNFAWSLWSGSRAVRGPDRQAGGGQLTDRRIHAAASVATHAQLLEDRVHVVLHRRDLDTERAGDFLVGAACLDEPEDLALALGQPGSRVLRRLPPSDCRQEDPGDAWRARCPTTHDASDGCNDLAKRRPPRDVTRDTGLRACHHVLLGLRDTERDDLGRRSRGKDRAYRLDRIEARQVDDDHVWMVAADDLHTFTGVCARDKRELTRLASMAPTLSRRHGRPATLTTAP